MIILFTETDDPRGTSHVEVFDPTWDDLRRAILSLDGVTRRNVWIVNHVRDDLDPETDATHLRRIDEAPKLVVSGKSRAGFAIVAELPNEEAAIVLRAICAGGRHDAFDVDSVLGVVWSFVERGDWESEVDWERLI